MSEVLDKSMWNMYQIMKDDNFTFNGYSNEDKILMINHILPYFVRVEEYEICTELKNALQTNINL